MLQTMKDNIPFMPMLLVLLALVACNATAGQKLAIQTTGPSVPTTAQSGAGTTVDELSVADCPEAEPGAHQLIDAARGICLLYPDNFSVSEYGDGIGYTLVILSLMGNHESPVIWLTFEPANGRSLEEVTTQRLTDYAFPDTQSQTITLGSVPASMLDNLPGQDTNRRIVAVHDDRVIDIVIDHIGENYGAAGEQAEAAYNMITSSFQFIGLDPEALLIAGPECPELVKDSTIYTNEPAGYCLLIPAPYTVQEIDPEREIAFFIGTIQDVSHARLYITVEDAGGRLLDEITAEIEAKIETSTPGLDVMPSFGYMLDGVLANQFDQVPGQDVSRQVVAVHNNQLYKLTFIPDDPTADAYAEMQTLYDMVMDSFSFTTAGKGGDMGTSSAAPSGMIFRWVWHDVCESGKNGQPSPTLPPECRARIRGLGDRYSRS